MGMGMMSFCQINITELRHSQICAQFHCENNTDARVWTLYHIISQLFSPSVYQTAQNYFFQKKIHLLGKYDYCLVNSVADKTVFTQFHCRLGDRNTQQLTVPEQWQIEDQTAQKTTGNAGDHRTAVPANVPTNVNASCSALVTKAPKSLRPSLLMLH